MWLELMVDSNVLDYDRIYNRINEKADPEYQN